MKLPRIVLGLLFYCYTGRTSIPSSIAPPSSKSALRPTKLRLSHSSESLESKFSSESSHDVLESKAESSESSMSNTSRRMATAASELLNESSRFDENNFISRLKERCWEPIKPLNTGRRQIFDIFVIGLMIRPIMHHNFFMFRSHLELPSYLSLRYSLSAHSI